MLIFGKVDFTAEKVAQYEDTKIEKLKISPATMSDILLIWLCWLVYMLLKGKTLGLVSIIQHNFIIMSTIKDRALKWMIQTLIELIQETYKSSNIIEDFNITPNPNL